MIFTYQSFSVFIVSVGNLLLYLWLWFFFLGVSFSSSPGDSSERGIFETDSTEGVEWWSCKKSLVWLFVDKSVVKISSPKVSPVGDISENCVLNVNLWFRISLIELESKFISERIELVCSSILLASRIFFSFYMCQLVWRTIVSKKNKNLLSCHLWVHLHKLHYRLGYVLFVLTHP